MEGFDFRFPQTRELVGVVRPAHTNEIASKVFPKMAGHVTEKTTKSSGTNLIVLVDLLEVSIKPFQTCFQFIPNGSIGIRGHYDGSGSEDDG